MCSCSTSKSHAARHREGLDSRVDPPASGRLWDRPQSEGDSRGREFWEGTVSGPFDRPLVWAESPRSNIINLSMMQDQTLSAVRVSIFFP